MSVAHKFNPKAAKSSGSPLEFWSHLPDWANAITHSLLLALRERDPYTFGHCKRVSIAARNLAAAAGLNPFEQQVVEIASLFHDLGKLGIPDSILLKPGRLSQTEEAIMRDHPVKSAQILTPLAGVPTFHAALPGISHHHERIDGKGYPFGLAGDQIPLFSRLILIVDTFDAMTTNRPYRKKFDAEHAYKELKTFAGRQFDRHLVDTFIKAHPTWKPAETEKEVAAQETALEQLTESAAKSVDLSPGIASLKKAA